MAEGPPEVLDCSTDAAATNSLLGLRIGAIFAILFISRWGAVCHLSIFQCAYCAASERGQQPDCQQDELLAAVWE